MLASIFSLNVIQTALELGCIYGLVALALFLSYSILNIADLSTDGCFTLGCAVACQVALTGHPILALFAAMAAGVCSGFVTAFLQTRLGVESIMAGIIVNTGLYTINLAVMGFSSTMSLVKTDTVFSLAKSALAFTGGWYKLVIAAAVIVLACAAMVGFLGTRLGLSIRATGDNAAMVRASSINPAFTITVGLCISGALTALSGGLLAQYQKSSDINVGTGMVTIALASLIIGETLVGKRTMVRRVLGVVFGSCLYRFIVAVALRFNVPAAAMKLVSALIVAVAISMPAIRAKHTDAVWHSIFYSIENVCGHDVVVIVRDEVVSVRRLEILHGGLHLVGVEVPLLNAGGRIVERLEAHIVHADFVIGRVIECDLFCPVDAWVIARVDVSLQHGGKLAGAFLPSG